MLKRQRNTQSGIALGPILFIIVILAIIAAAIAAGNVGFNANSNTESAKAMAEVIVQTCDDYQRAVQMMVMQNGCDVTTSDYTPNGGGYPTGATWTSGDYTSNNGTNHSGNGSCTLFDPRGGGIAFKPFPSAALMSPATGAYTSASDGGVNEDAYAGYPLPFGTTCINGVGTCPLGSSLANATIIMFVPYLNYATCQQINKILGIAWDPKSTTITQASDYLYNVFLGGAGRPRNAGGFIAGGGPSGHTGVSEACAYDNNSNGHNSAFAFMCPVMIR